MVAVRIGRLAKVLTYVRKQERRWIEQRQREAGICSDVHRASVSDNFESDTNKMNSIAHRGLKIWPREINTVNHVACAALRHCFATKKAFATLRFTRCDLHGDLIVCPILSEVG